MLIIKWKLLVVGEDYEFSRERKNTSPLKSRSQNKLSTDQLTKYEATTKLRIESCVIRLSNEQSGKAMTGTFENAERPLLESAPPPNRGQNYYEYLTVYIHSLRSLFL